MALPQRDRQRADPPFLLLVDSRFRGNDGGEGSRRAPAARKRCISSCLGMMPHFSVEKVLVVARDRIKRWCLKGPVLTSGAPLARGVLANVSQGFDRLGGW